MECSNLEIQDIETRACCSELHLEKGSLCSDSSGALNFLFLTATTSEGLQTSCFGFAGKNALAAGEMISSSLKPFFIGRSALDREKAWHQFRTADRWWHHLPSGHTGLLILFLDPECACGKPATISLPGWVS